MLVHSDLSMYCFLEWMCVRFARKANDSCLLVKLWPLPTISQLSIKLGVIFSLQIQNCDYSMDSFCSVNGLRLAIFAAAEPQTTVESLVNDLPPPINDHPLFTTVFPLMNSIRCINFPSSMTTLQMWPVTMAIWILSMNDHPIGGQYIF